MPWLVSHKVYISKHVVFDEIFFPFVSNKSFYDNIMQASLHLTKLSDVDEWIQATTQSGINCQIEPIPHHIMSTPH